MQSNNNLYKNLPGNINNRGPNYPSSRMNNEFQSKKENYNNQQANYNNMNYNYDQGFSNMQNNNGNNLNYNKQPYSNNMNMNNKPSYGNSNNFNNNFNNMNMNNNNNNKANYADELNQAKESLKLLKLKMNNGGSMGGNPSGFGGNLNKDNNIYIPNSNKNVQANANYRKPFKPNLNANSANDDFMDDGGNFNNNNNNNNIRGLGSLGANNNRSNIGSRLNSNANNNMNKMGTNNMGVNLNQYKISSNYQDQPQMQRPNTRSKTNSTSTPMNNNNNNFSNAKARVGPNHNTKLTPSTKQGKDTNLINRPNFQVEELEDDRPAFNPKGAKFDPYEDDNELDDGEDDGTRIQCRQCGRRFNPDAIQKHEKVCKKVFCAERKKFDMKKKRILDSEHAMILRRAEVTEKNGNNNAKNNAKKAKWKKQSEEFRAILRGGKTGPGTAVPSSITDDYKHCNMCNRKYNENAYAKHLPTCERRTKEAMLKKGNAPNIQSNINMQGGNRNANYGNQMGGNRMGSNMMNNNLSSKYGRK